MADSQGKKVVEKASTETLRGWMEQVAAANVQQRPMQVTAAIVQQRSMQVVESKALLCSRGQCRWGAILMLQ